MSHWNSTSETTNRRLTAHAGVVTSWLCACICLSSRLGLFALQNGKQTRAVILPDNSAIVLYRTTNDEVYCSDANSTAYKFPMIDANVIESEHPG